MTKPSYKVTRSDLVGVYFRHFLYLHGLSYERNLSVGYLNMVGPVLKKMFPDKKELAKWMTMHMNFYNVTPPLNPIVAGVDLAMTEGGADPETILAFKTGVMGPLCGIGDTIFWFVLAPIAYGIGASMALQGSWLGPVVALILYVPARWYLSWWFLTTGYKEGQTVLTIVRDRIEEFKSIMYSFAMLMVGSLIVNFISITTPLVIPSIGFKLQDVFNSLMPKFLPLGFSFMTFLMLRRGIKVTYVVVLVLIIGFILGFLGIIA